MSLAIGREREKITYKVGISLCYNTFYRKSEDITSNKLYVVPLASVTFSLPLKQKISFFYQYLTWMAGIDQLTKLPNVSSTTTVRMPSHIKNPTSIMPKLTSTYSFIRPITQTSVFVTVAYSITGHGMRLAINQNGTANSTYWDDNGHSKSANLTISATQGMMAIPIDTKFSLRWNYNKGTSLFNDKANITRSQSIGGSVTFSSRFKGSWNGELFTSYNQNLMHNNLNDLSCKHRRWEEWIKISFVKNKWICWMKLALTKTYNRGNEIAEDDELTDLACCIERKFGNFSIKLEGENLLNLHSYTLQDSYLTTYSMAIYKYDRLGFIMLSSSLYF